MIDEYTCENCHGTFEKAWSDEEALAEAEAHGFEEPYGVLCDDCHQRFMVWARKHGLVS